MVIYARFDYSGLKDLPFEMLDVFVCAESEEELNTIRERENAKPTFGEKLRYLCIYDSKERFLADILRESIFKHVYDMSIFVRCPDIASSISSEKRVASCNLFSLPEVVPIGEPVKQPLTPPEPDLPTHEKLHEEKHILSTKPEPVEEFITALQQRDLSVLFLDSKDEADFKRIRFKALGFETLLFPYKDKFFVVISIEEFEKPILEYIRDCANTHLKKKIDIEIGLPEIVTEEPQEYIRPDTKEKALEALKKNNPYKREITDQEVVAVMLWYPRLWDNILNRVLEYDPETKEYYRLRKDWSRTIKGISIYARGLTTLIGITDRTYNFTSYSENPEKKDTFYTVTVKAVDDEFVVDSNDPDRTSDVVVGITIDGKRQVERFITKHMVSAIISFMHRG